LISEIKGFCQEKGILDIILFGSVVRGKRKPNDIDVALIFKDKEDLDIAYELRKVFESEGIEVEVVALTYKKIFDPGFLPRENILSEGYSLVNGGFLSESLGLASYEAFIYNLKKFSQSDRMRFHYSLNGRGGNKGFLEETNSIRLAAAVILVPVKNAEKFGDYLGSWEIEYRRVRVLVPKSVSEYGGFDG